MEKKENKLNINCDNCGDVIELGDTMSYTSGGYSAFCTEPECLVNGEFITSLEHDWF